MREFCLPFSLREKRFSIKRLATACSCKKNVEYLQKKIENCQEINFNFYQFVRDLGAIFLAELSGKGPSTCHGDYDRNIPVYDFSGSISLSAQIVAFSSGYTPIVDT